MQQDDLQKFLTDFSAERLALLQRHEAAARVVSHYDFNNTYQYVIAREETHLSWLESALVEFGAALPQTTLPLPAPDAPAGKKVEVAAYRDILAGRREAPRRVRGALAGPRRDRDARPPPHDARTWSSASRSSTSGCSSRPRPASRTSSAAAPAAPPASAPCCRLAGRNRRDSRRCRPRQQPRRSRKPSPRGACRARVLHRSAAGFHLPRHRAGRRRAAAHVSERGRGRGDLARGEDAARAPARDRAGPRTGAAVSRRAAHPRSGSDSLRRCRDRRARRSSCRTRVSGSAGSCWSRWPRLRRTGAIR